MGFGFPPRSGRRELGWSIIRPSPSQPSPGPPASTPPGPPAPVRRSTAGSLLLRRHGDFHTVIVSAAGPVRRGWYSLPGDRHFQGPPAPWHQRDPGIFCRPPVGDPLRRADGKQDTLGVAPAPPVTQVRRLGTGSPFSTHLPRNSASARKWASSAKNILPPVRPASSHRAAYSVAKASRLASSALSSRFLGRLKANPRRCRACPRVDGGNSGNCYGSG